MSSAIGSIPPALRVLTEVESFEAPATVSAGSAQADPSRAALYQSFGASMFPTGPFGTRTPQNAEDSAILLAQAALAIDAANREAKDARIANVTSGARNSIGRAVADIVAVAQEQKTAQDARVAADAARTMAVGQEAGLVTTVADLDGRITQVEDKIADDGTRIAAVDAQIATVAAQIDSAPSEDAKQPLRARLGDLRADRAELEATRDGHRAERAELGSQRTHAVASLTTVRAEITRLGGVIAALVGTLAALDVKSQASAAALVRAYSQVALQAQDLRGAQRHDVVESANLDRSLDEVSEILDSFRADALARVADTAQADRLRDDETLRRVLETTLGLVAGLAEVMDVLGKTADRLPGDAAVDRREPAPRSGPRLQLSL